MSNNDDPDRSQGRHHAPLAASWDPRSRLEEEDDEQRSDRKRRSWHGWRIYAVPLLVVVTALAVFHSTHQSAVGTRSTAAVPPAEPPNMPEIPSASAGQPADAKLFSADLPPGSPFPVTGTGTYDIAPGTGPRVGSGTLYRYTVEIEVGVTLAEGNDSFASLVQETLADPRSWTNQKGPGVALERVDTRGPTPDFRVTLVSQATARQVCGYSQGLPFDTSCRVNDRVYINAARWVRGAVAFHGDLATYRRYAINHEVGHRFGLIHVGCPANGALAPVMMQQTLSVSNNELHDLNNLSQQGSVPIPADGAVCRPNAWPFPVDDSGR